MVNKDVKKTTSLTIWTSLEISLNKSWLTEEWFTYKLLLIFFPLNFFYFTPGCNSVKLFKCLRWSIIIIIVLQIFLSTQLLKCHARLNL